MYSHIPYALGMSNYGRIEKALIYLHEHQKEQPSLEEIARYVKLSPEHFQRVFTEWAGVSPKKFLQYLSVERAKKILAHNNILLTAHKTGLSGTGRLHDLFIKIEGMTPGEYKRGGEQLSIQYSIGISRFGSYLVASTDKGICNLFFYEGSATHALKELRSLWPHATIIRKATTFHKQIEKYFSTHSTQSIRLHVKGTPFELKVWQALLSIPEGKLASYNQVARSITQVNASRAVGTALSKNPIAYVIPCHRVIKSLGTIGSYHWGVARKSALIGYEAAQNS